MLTLYIPCTKKTVDRKIWKGVQSPKLFGNKLRFCTFLLKLCVCVHLRTCMSVQSVVLERTCLSVQLRSECNVLHMRDFTAGHVHMSCTLAWWQKDCVKTFALLQYTHAGHVHMHACWQKASISWVLCSTCFAAVQCIAWVYRTQLRRKKRHQKTTSALGWSHSATTEKTTSKDNVRPRMITFRYDGKTTSKDNVCSRMPNICIPMQFHYISHLSMYRCKLRCMLNIFSKRLFSCMQSSIHLRRKKRHQKTTSALGCYDGKNDIKRQRLLSDASMHASPCNLT